MLKRHFFAIAVLLAASACGNNVETATKELPSQKINPANAISQETPVPESPIENPVTTKPVEAPVIAYSNQSFEFVIDHSITAIVPTLQGGAIESWQVQPPLPTGLSVNAVTGVIEGTPTELSMATDYVVSATNSTGSSIVSLHIAVIDEAPTSLVYDSATMLLRLHENMTVRTPTLVGGGQGVSFSVTPMLPAGMQLDASSGVISGGPTVLSPPVSYTITAANSGGTVSAVVSIEINVERLLTESFAVVPTALPYAAGWGAAAAVGDYLYLFGGQASSRGTDGTKNQRIQRAAKSNPTQFEIVSGKTLPVKVSWTAAVIVGSEILIYGSEGARRAIIKASTVDPTTWTNTGATLPGDLFAHSVQVINDTVYIIGSGTGAGTNLWSAPVTDPATVTNTGITLPFYGGYRPTYVIWRIHLKRRRRQRLARSGQ
jgi:hypothetical protein